MLGQIESNFRCSLALSFLPLYIFFLHLPRWTDVYEPTQRTFFYTQIIVPCRYSVPPEAISIKQRPVWRQLEKSGKLLRQKKKIEQEKLESHGLSND